jgi:hypothetical protein
LQSRLLKFRFRNGSCMGLGLSNYRMVFRCKRGRHGSGQLKTLILSDGLIRLQPCNLTSWVCNDSASCKHDPIDPVNPTRTETERINTNKSREE